MPKLLRVQLAHAYIAQPAIQIGYSMISGGLGTVKAMVIEQPMLIAQARISTLNLNLLLRQSACIQSIVGLKISFILYFS